VFREEIRRAKAVLRTSAASRSRLPRAELLHRAGRAVGYAILAEEGFQYDSSVYPIMHDRYGDREAPRFPYEIWRRGDQKLLEFPIGTVRLGGVNCRSVVGATSVSCRAA